MLQKITRQFSILQSERLRLTKLTHSFSTNPSLFPSFINSIQTILLLTNNIQSNFKQLLDLNQITTLFQVYNTITNELTTKLTQLWNQSQLINKSSNISQNNCQFCNICRGNINQNNIKETIISLEESKNSEFQLMLQQLQKTIDEPLYTQSQNNSFESLLFFQLAQRQKVLNLNCNRMQQFIQIINSTLSDLSKLKQLQLNSSTQTLPQYSNPRTINQKIILLLKQSFSQKIPPWIQKMFITIINNYINQQNYKKISIGIQTQPSSHHTKQLKQTIKQNKLFIKQIKQLNQQLKQFKQLKLCYKKLEQLNSEYASTIAKMSTQTYRKQNCQEKKQNKAQKSLQTADDEDLTKEKPKNQQQNLEDYREGNYNNSSHAMKKHKAAKSTKLPKLLKTQHSQSKIHLQSPSSNSQKQISQNKSITSSKKSLTDHSSFPFSQRKQPITSSKNHTNTIISEQCHDYIQTQTQNKQQIQLLNNNQNQPPNNTQINQITQQNNNDQNTQNSNKQSPQQTNQIPNQLTQNSNTQNQQILHPNPSYLNKQNNFPHIKNPLKKLKFSNQQSQPIQNKNQHWKRQTKQQLIQHQKPIIKQYKTQNNYQSLHQQLNNLNQYSIYKSTKQKKLNNLRYYQQDYQPPILQYKSTEQLFSHQKHHTELQKRQIKNQNNILQQNKIKDIYQKVIHSFHPLPDIHNKVKICRTEQIQSTSNSNHKRFCNKQICQTEQIQSTSNSKIFRSKQASLKTFDALRKSHALTKSINYSTFEQIIQKAEQIHERPIAESLSNEGNFKNLIDQEQNNILNIAKRKIYGQLFVNKIQAYKYQKSMAKSYHKTVVKKLNQKQLDYCFQMYTNLCSAKKVNHEIYNEFCAVLRYPYQTLYNNFEVINFVSQMTFQTFEYFLRKIIIIHRSCKKNQQSIVCFHIQQINNSLKQIINGSM